MCTCGALRWPSRCLQVAPLSSRMVTCTASKTPNVMHIFERVPDNVYVYAARRTAAWRTPTVAKFLRYLSLRLSPRERVGYRLLHSRQHDVQPRPCPLHTDLFHQHVDHVLIDPKGALKAPRDTASSARGPRCPRNGTRDAPWEDGSVGVFSAVFRKDRMGARTGSAVCEAMAAAACRCR